MREMMGKRKEKMSEDEKQAKSSVLERMIEEMTGIMGDKAESLKKVTVASDSKEGLEKGLEKAKQIIDKSPEEADMEDSEHEMAESPEHEMSESEDEEDSDEALEAKIQELLAKKEARKAK